MKKATTIFAVAALILSASVANAGTIVSADWTAYTTGTGTGTVESVDISATSSDTAPFVGFSNNRFSSSAWEAGMPLPVGHNSIIAANVNAGEYQQFDFSSPISGLLYIENFDSSSEATIIASGATSLSLASGSSSISFATSAIDGGVLATSNSSFDGEGDAVLAFDGPVTSIRVQYSNGTGDNGVFYTVAINNPEPSSVAMLLTASLGMISLVRRRRR